MPTFLPIGLLAGLVAAVVFASAASGPSLSRLVLFTLAFVPAFLAGLGWGWRAAAVAAIAGSILIGLFTNALVASVYFLTQGIPVAVLCYLAGLHREVGPEAGSGAQPVIEWYPISRLVMWAAIMAGAVGALSIAVIGGDLDTLRAKLKAFLETEVVRQLPPVDGKGFGEPELAALTELSVMMLPAATTIFWLAALLFDFWLAARITLASGRLDRPWPDLADLQFPAMAPLILATAIAGTFLDGLVGLMATAFAVALLIAFLLKGLGMAHVMTRGSSLRGFQLGALYAMLLVFNIWAALAIALFAIAEPFLPVRRRPPPTPPPAGPPAGPMS